MLRHARLSGEMLGNSDYPMTEASGLMAMSILADCCAGKTRARITDRGAAYATLAGLLSQNAGVDARRPRAPQEQLVQISLEVINTGPLSIERLIEFREREYNERGHTLRDLRHRYIAHLESYVRRLTTEIGNQSDAREVKRQFADDMRRDVAELKKELGDAGREAMLSKEFIITATAAMGAMATWLFSVPIPIAETVTLAGVPVYVGGSIATANKLFTSRRSVMQKHPMAYLYGLRG
jgi:hypothetical protein